MNTATKQEIDFEGLYLSDVFTADYIKRGHSLILEVKPVEIENARRDEYLVLSSRYERGGDHSFSVNVRFPDSRKSGDVSEISEALSLVMNHPQTPEVIINSLGEALTELSNEIDYNSVEIIHRSLIAHNGKKTKTE